MSRRRYRSRSSGGPCGRTPLRQGVVPGDLLSDQENDRDLVSDAQGCDQIV
jgi:hypothetical protein